jgi:hypothetical protein
VLAVKEKSVRSSAFRPACVLISGCHISNLKKLASWTDNPNTDASATAQRPFSGHSCVRISQNVCRQRNNSLPAAPENLGERVRGRAGRNGRQLPRRTHETSTDRVRYRRYTGMRWHALTMHIRRIFYAPRRCIAPTSTCVPTQETG